MTDEKEFQFSVGDVEIDKSFFLEDPQRLVTWGINSKDRNLLNKKENMKFKKLFDDGSDISFEQKVLKSRVKERFSGFFNVFHFFMFEKDL